MNPYLGKRPGRDPRFPQMHFGDAGSTFCVFCSVGGLLIPLPGPADQDTSHVRLYVLWIVVGAVPLVLFARNEETSLP